MRQIMTPEEEALFLDGFIEASGNASMVVVTEVRDALERQLGRKVPLSSVYGLLKRHGWWQATLS